MLQLNNRFDFISFCVISVLILLISLPTLYSVHSRLNLVATLPETINIPVKIDAPTITRPTPPPEIIAPPNINNDRETTPPPSDKPPAIHNTASVNQSVFRLNDAYAYRQNDMLWAEQTIGLTSQALFNYGCTITSVAMAASNLMQTRITPGDIETNLQSHQGFTNTGLLIWDRLQLATDGQVQVTIAAKPSHEAIQKCAAQNGYPVVKIKLSSGIIHWVLIVGSAEQDYLIRDPLVGNPNDAPIWLSQRSDNIYALRCLIRTEDG